VCLFLTLASLSLLFLSPFSFPPISLSPSAFPYPSFQSTSLFAKTKNQNQNTIHSPQNSTPVPQYPHELQHCPAAQVPPTPPTQLPAWQYSGPVPQYLKTLQQRPLAQGARAHEPVWRSWRGENGEERICGMRKRRRKERVGRMERWVCIFGLGLGCWERGVE
jgi:hypothetical protein